MEQPKRPRLPNGQRMRRVFATLDDETIERARELGHGNISAGIRKALRLDGPATLDANPNTESPAPD